MKSTIGRRLGYAFLVMIALMTAMVGITLRGFDKVISSLDNMEREAVKRGASGNLRFGIAQLLMASNDYIITENEYFQREYNRLSSRVDEFYDQFIQLPLTEEEQQLLAGIKQDLDSIRTYSAQICSIQHPRQSPKAWALMETVDYRFGDDVNRKTTEIFDGISRRIEQHRLQAEANKGNATNSIYGITFLGVVISLVVSYLTVQRISKPIITVTKAANGIANGDYSQRPTVKTHDEVAVLAESFCRMAESIQQSQRALEESKRLTESIVATVSSGLLVFGSDGRIPSVNNSFCDIFGLPHSLLTDQHIGPVFEELGISEECCSRILARQPFRDVECVYSDPTRGTRIFSMTLFPIRIANGESLLVIDDITKRKLTEQIILDKEKRFRALIENSSDGLSVISADGTLLYGTPANSRIVGYPHGELLNKNVFALIHPDDSPSIMDLFAQLLKKPSRVMTAELRFQRKDGTWRWIEPTATNCLHDPTIRGVVINFRDITERKRVEEALQESEEKHRTLIDNIQDGVFIIQDAKMQFVNEAFARMVGFAVEEVIGMDFRQLVAPEDWEVVADHYRRRQAGEDVPREYEFRSLHKDGKTRILVNMNVGLVDYRGRVASMGTVKDITERKRAEEVLRESEERFRIVANQTGQLIYDYDILTGFIAWSGAIESVTGYSVEEYSAIDIDRWTEMIHPDDRQQALDLLEKVIASASEYNIEYRFRRKDGSYITVADRGGFMIDTGGKASRMLGAMSDISERKLAEEELAEREKRYSALFNLSPSGIVLEDTEGNIVDVNEAFCKSLGYTREELVGKNVRVLASPEQLSVIEHHIALLRSDKMLEHVVHDVRKDGTLCWMELHETSISLASGQQGFLVVAHDITERKRAEERIRLLAHTMESISEMTCIIDFEDRITFVNQAFLDRYGYTFDQIIGQHVGVLRSPNVPSEIYDEISHQSRKGGWNGEILNVTKDGREFPVFLRTSQIKDEKGAVIGLAAIAADITVQKKAEEALKQSEEQYRKFFEDDLTGDYITTLDGEVLACNPAFARIFGFTSVEEVLSTNINALYSDPDERKKFVQLIREKKRLEYYEMEYIRRDGKRVYGVENAIGIFDAQGNLVQSRGYLFDDTKRKLIEAQLFQVQKLESIGTLASGIAHDFNNILGIIMGHSSLLEERKLEPAEFSQSIERIVTATQRGASLVRQILTFARKTEILFETVNVNNLVKEITKLLSETFPKTVEVVATLQKDLPSIAADVTQIHQVLLNLCVNARDVMPRGGRLTICTRVADAESLSARFPKATAREYLQIDVADTGAGMDDQTRNRIFEPFFTTKEPGKGTGLGLAVVFGIVESHKGLIDVESEVGKGTTFRVFLPVPERSLETAKSKGGKAEKIRGGSETILLVEDEEMLRDLMKAILVSNGYKVLTAGDGEEAIDIYSRHQADIAVVVTDFGLPKFSGDEVFKKLNAINPRVNVVITSGYIDPAVKSNLDKAGVKHFVQKPYQPDEILKTIREVIE